MRRPPGPDTDADRSTWWCPVKTNDRGRQLIVDFEELRLEAYPDPASALGIEMAKPAKKRRPNWLCLPGDPWTIGIGATGPGIGPGVVWTRDHAWDRFERDLAIRELAIARSVAAPVNENQFAALVSFAFNAGVAAFRTSTLLAKLNEGDYLGAAEEFPRWTKAGCGTRTGCRTLAGLVRRREAEQALFLAPVSLRRAA